MLPASLCAKIMVFRRITRIIEVVLNERAVSVDAFSESDEERMSKIIIFAYVSSTAVDMDYDIKDKMEWTIIFIREFGRKYGLSMKQAFNYLSRFKGIDFIDRHYDYVHTQSFASMVDDIAEYCHRHGGALV